jgi:cell wall-associated NlpC family hydrolase
MIASDIVTIARTLIGTPYQHQGRVAGLALDCAGVPVHVAKELGIELAHYTRYGRLPVPAEMRAALDAHLLRVPTHSMQIGDVAWLRFQREPQHLAIVGDYHLGGFSLIHAYNGAGLKKVVEHRLDPTWMARIVAVWRYRGLSE